MKQTHQARSSEHGTEPREYASNYSLVSEHGTASNWSLVSGFRSTYSGGHADHIQHSHETAQHLGECIALAFLNYLEARISASIIQLLTDSIGSLYQALALSSAALLQHAGRDGLHGHGHAHASFIS